MGWLYFDGKIEDLFFARPASSVVMVGAVAAAVLLTVFLYWFQQGIPKWARILLATTRLAVLVLVIALFFEPTATVTQKQTNKRCLPVLIDVSESMSVRDQRKRSNEIGEAAVALGILPFSSNSKDVEHNSLALSDKQLHAIAEATRLDLATSLLSKSARPMLQSLNEDLEINYHTFGSQLRQLGDGESGGADSLAGLQADAQETSIASALETLVRTNRGTPLAGIVVLSDGLENSSLRVEEAAYDLGVRGIPVYTVPIGVVDPDDVSIRSVIMQQVAFTGDKVPVRVQIQSKGYEKRTTDLKVLLDGRNVAQKSVTLEGGLQFEEIFFNVDVIERGAVRIDVEIDRLPDESTAVNNHAKRSIRVVNEKINVLCIEGSARWEYRYLSAMLKRDPRIDATFIATRAQPDLARSSSEYIEKFPEDPEEAFAYDLVILGDVDSSFFSREAFQRIEELVRDRGGSLLMLCGARFAPTSYGDTPLERMLPVAFDPGGEWEDVGDDIYPVLTPEGRSSLVMTLENDREQNDLIWSRVAPLDRVPPLRALRPGATVLAELSDSQARSESFPLVSWQRYGAGKCMMIASDRFWLLRFKTGDKYHWRVWSQCIQFLTLSRLMGEHKMIRIETDRATYPVDGQVMLYAKVLGDDFEPVRKAGFEVEVSMLGDDGAAVEPRRITLRPDASNSDLYEGYFSPSSAGDYLVVANENDRVNANSVEFQVAEFRPELVKTDMQLNHLRRIAELSGGECLDVSQFQKLSALLNREPYTVVIRTQYQLWDNGLIIWLLAGLVGFEWILRRKYDLP